MTVQTLSVDALQLLFDLNRRSQPYTSLRRRLGDSLTRTIDAIDELLAEELIERVPGPGGYSVYRVTG